MAGEIFFCAINFKNAHILTYNYTFTIYICTCKLITILCLERYYSTGFASFFYSNISLLWFCLFVDFMVHSLGHIYVLQSVYLIAINFYMPILLHYSTSFCMTSNVFDCVFGRYSNGTPHVCLYFRVVKKINKVLSTQHFLLYISVCMSHKHDASSFNTCTTHMYEYMSLSKKSDIRVIIVVLYSYYILILFQ